MLKRSILSAGVSIIAICSFGASSAVAETEPKEPKGAAPMGAVEAVALDAASESADAVAAGMAQTTGEEVTAEEPDPDNMAASLNAQQSLSQEFTLTRTVNGQVVETTRREVSLDGAGPLRQSEARVTLMESLRQSYDSELLSRTEAYEEAKLNFALADSNLDQQVDVAEFDRLATILADAESPSDDDATPATPVRSARLEFVEGLGAADQAAMSPQPKIDTIIGDDGVVGEKAFVLEMLKEFDAADADGDAILAKGELASYRNAIIGWTRN